MSNIGLKLSKTWQKILHKDFRYAHYDKYVWIDKITHISIYDILKELQDNRKWLEISRQTNSCIVILDNKGSAITYGSNKNSRFYLLFYSIETDIYPIFLTKNSNQEFEFSAGSQFMSKNEVKCTKSACRWISKFSNFFGSIEFYTYIYRVPHGTLVFLDQLIQT